jgi:hypothetical protein
LRELNNEGNQARFLFHRSWGKTAKNILIVVIFEERKETIERRKRRSSPLVARPDRPAPIPGEGRGTRRCLPEQKGGGGTTGRRRNGREGPKGGGSACFVRWGPSLPDLRGRRRREGGARGMSGFLNCVGSLINL